MFVFAETFTNRNSNLAQELECLVGEVAVDKPIISYRTPSSTCKFRTVSRTSWNHASRHRRKERSIPAAHFAVVIIQMDCDDLSAIIGSNEARVNSNYPTKRRSCQLIQSLIQLSHSGRCLDEQVDQLPRSPSLSERSPPRQTVTNHTQLLLDRSSNEFPSYDQI